MRNYIVVGATIFTGRFVVGLAHRNVGRVARTNFFQVMFWVRYRPPHVRSSEKLAASLPWDDSRVAEQRFPWLEQDDQFPRDEGDDRPAAREGRVRGGARKKVLQREFLRLPCHGSESTVEMRQYLQLTSM